MGEPQLPTQRRVTTQKQSIANGWVIIGFILVAGISYVVGALYGQSVRNATSSFLASQDDLDLSTLQQTYSTLKNNYDGTLDKTKLIAGANKGLVAAAGDQYTEYMTRAESEEFNNNLSGTIGGGIGVEIGLRNDTPTVVRVLERNPAQKAGVMVGDVIVKVNDEDSTKWTVSQIVEKIRGEAGTTVRLTVLRDGKTHDITVIREVVNNPSAYGEVKDGIGILTVTRFDDQTGSLAKQVARDFQKQGVKGVILDLRGNGGGYVTAAQAVAGLWLDDQVVVVEKTAGKTVAELKSGRDPILKGIPTVVLVNKSSASASEIVAGALRDHKAATLIGTVTFGKGSVQKIIGLDDGATLKVTIAKWFTPSGVNISETGIKPNKEVDRTAEDFNANKDPQLDAALSQLNG